METALRFIAVLGMSAVVAPLPGWAAEPPPIEPGGAVEPEAVPPVDVPPVDVPPADEPHVDEDRTPRSGTPLPAPEPSSGGFGEGACWGSLGGCTALGCLPGAGTALGTTFVLTLVNAALATDGIGGVCLAVAGIGGGVLVGAPSVLLLGPCASGGALAGGLVGALIDERSLSPVFLGALPGIAVGALGTAGSVWGLVELGNSSGDFLLPASILGVSAALAFAAGPVTITGITIADALAEAPPPPPAKKAEAAQEVVLLSASRMAF